MHQQFNIQQLYVLPTLYLCVLYLSENKQRLFPYTTLTDWFLQARRSVYCAVRTGSLDIIAVYFNLLRLSLSGLSPRSLGFGPRPVHPQIAVTKMTLWQFSPPVLLFPPVNVTPPTPHTHLHLHVVVSRRTNCRGLVTFYKQGSFLNRRGTSSDRKSFVLNFQRFEGRTDGHQTCTWPE